MQSKRVLREATCKSEYDRVYTYNYAARSNSRRLRVLRNSKQGYQRTVLIHDTKVIDNVSVKRG